MHTRLFICTAEQTPGYALAHYGANQWGRSSRQSRLYTLNRDNVGKDHLSRQETGSGQTCTFIYRRNQCNQWHAFTRNNQAIIKQCRQVKTHEEKNYPLLLFPLYILTLTGYTYNMLPSGPFRGSLARKNRRQRQRKV